MTRIPFALIAVLAATGCGDGSHPDVSYAVAINPVHDCEKGPNASIEASNSGFKLTSTCERILIKGSNNKIAIEAAKRIDIDGAKNDIEVSAVDIIKVNGTENAVKFKKKGVTREIPDVVAIGDSNSLTQLSD